MPEFPCNICNYICSSNSSLRFHIREKHTFSKCIEINCSLCNELFYNPSKYKKCQECRDLRKSLNTNDLVYGNYVYNNNKQYFIDLGFVTEVCNVYTCRKHDCKEHENESEKTVCQSQKCHNMYIKNGYNSCEIYRERNNKSKNKIRNATIELKKQLGGCCVECGDTTLYNLEFDHIDPTTKTKQITRMAPADWYSEIDKIQLLCGNHHRIKSRHEMIEIHKNNEISNSVKSSRKLKEIIDKIKLEIGACQICNWSCDNDADFCSVIDFDHYEKNKIKKVSDILNLKDKIKEVMKCRAICRQCHTNVTCIERGGKMLQIQMSKPEYEALVIKLMDLEKSNEMNQKIRIICERKLKEIKDQENLIEEVRISKIKAPITTKRIVIQRNDDTIINYFKNTKDASIAFDVHDSNISRACNNVGRMCRDFYWEYKEVGINFVIPEPKLFKRN
jgi:hypothetical protein